MLREKAQNIIGKNIFATRWILFPINAVLVGALFAYVTAFLINFYHFVFYDASTNMETMMVSILGFVDAFMVANLVVMIVLGSHQIFIRRFDINKEEQPQFLDHIDTGILKVKIAMSICGITLVQILKDFMNLEKVEWSLALHKIIIHGVCLASALIMALIWRVTHPAGEKDAH